MSNPTQPPLPGDRNADRGSPDGAALDDEGPDVDRPAFGDPSAVVLRWSLPAEFSNTRADVYLSTKVGRLSRTRAGRIIAKGDFRLASGPLKPSTRLREGAALELWRFPPDSADALKTEPAVLYEDEGLLVVDKPGDLAVHPSARYLRQTLTRWLRDRAEGGRPANPCHRLDRETSGVLLCAKKREREREAKIAFAAGRVAKRYLAIVRGRWGPRRTLDLPLALQGDRGLVKIRMIPDPAGQPARTVVDEVHHAAETDRTLVACWPQTGRQHQIRAHLAAAGHPIVGDKLYAMGDPWFDAFTRDAAAVSELEHPRHALHAERLSLILDGAERTFAAPFPPSLLALLGDEGADGRFDLDTALADLPWPASPSARPR